MTDVLFVYFFVLSVFFSPFVCHSCLILQTSCPFEGDGIIEAFTSAFYITFSRRLSEDSGDAVPVAFGTWKKFMRENSYLLDLEKSFIFFLTHCSAVGQSIFLSPVNGPSTVLQYRFC